MVNHTRWESFHGFAIGEIRCSGRWVNAATRSEGLAKLDCPQTGLGSNDGRYRPVV